MYYNIITAKNFNDIEILSKAKINEIDNGYKLDPWFNYGEVNFAVIGEAALQMFREKYGVKLTRYADIKTDGKTSATILPSRESTTDSSTMGSVESTCSTSSG